MSWIEKIRQKPQEKKIRLIWTVIIAAAVVLICIWILLSRYERHLNMDTGIFNTISKGFKDFKDNFKK